MKEKLSLDKSIIFIHLMLITSVKNHDYSTCIKLISLLSMMNGDKNSCSDKMLTTHKREDHFVVIFYYNTAY